MTNDDFQDGRSGQSGRDQAKEGIKEGVRAVTGFLSALKDAIDETIRDIRDSGDLQPERAKEAARSTMRKAQETMDDVRERFDFVPRKEFDALRDELAALRRRLEVLETRSTTGSTGTPGGMGGMGGSGRSDFTIDGI